MRISATLDGKRLGPAEDDLFRTRLALALGGLSARIQGVSARFREVDGDVTCALIVRLRERGELRLVSHARTFEEVLDFIVSRARGAVSRHIYLERRSRT